MLRYIVVAWGLLSIPAIARAAQCQSQLPVAGLDFSSQLGKSVAVDGDLALVARIHQVFVIDLSSQTVLRELTGQGSGYGVSVALQGTLALVGVPGNGTAHGRVAIYETTTGDLLGRLAASDPGAGARFGWSVAVSGSTVLVGAPFDDDRGTDSGSAYVFDLATGQELRKLTASDGDAGDWFGYSVALDGDLAIVGALGDEPGFGYEGAGSAYVFEPSTGIELRKLTASDASSGDNFGNSAAVQGTLGVVGAWWDHPGSAYVFDLVTGQELHHLLGPATTHHFGISVGISGARTLVGASQDSALGHDAGAACLFDVASGASLLTLRAPNGQADDEFGYAVAIDGGRAVIGAPGFDGQSPNMGAAYLFDLSCVGIRFCDPSIPNSSGDSAEIEAYGSNLLIDEDLTLRATRLPPGRAGVFLVSRTPGLFYPPGSAGRICLWGDIGRYSGHIVVGPTGTLRIDVESVPVSSPTAIQPGDTWNFQCWYRDNDPGPTSNFTDAVGVTFQ